MTYALAVKLTAKEGQEEAVQAALLRVCELSRAEDGCIAFVPHRAITDPRVFFVYEHFVDRDAHAAHTLTDHFRDVVELELMPHVEFEMLEVEPL